MLIDSHCHLDLIQKKGYNLEDVISQLKENNVVGVQTICTQVNKFFEIENIANKYDIVFASVGTHPLNIVNCGPASLDEILNITKKNKVIGIGETGLDYHYDNDPENHKVQRENFITHIQAAQKTGLPLIVHTRDADEDTVKILQEQYTIKPFKAVIHCFTATNWLAKECLKLGFYISASGIITFKNALDIVNTFSEIPYDSILIETDSPYLAPVPHRGHDNMPFYVKYVAEKIAEIKREDYLNIANITTKNFLKLFDKVTIQI